MKLNKYQVELPCENGVRQQLDQLKVLDQLKICVLLKINITLYHIEIFEKFFTLKFTFISIKN